MYPNIFWFWSMYKSRILPPSKTLKSDKLLKLNTSLCILFSRLVASKNNTRLLLSPKQERTRSSRTCEAILIEQFTWLRSIGVCPMVCYVLKKFGLRIWRALSGVLDNLASILMTVALSPVSSFASRNRSICVSETR